MDSKLHNLFEDDNGSGLPDQEKCRELLQQWGLDGYSLYKDALDLTLKDLSQPHKYPTRNIFATTFNSFVIGLASERYPEWIRVSEDKRIDRVYLEPHPNFRICLKQLYGKQAKPANLKTGNVRKINAGELFDDNENLIRHLYLGAIMDEEQKYSMKEVRISHVNTKNSKTEWSLDMIEFVQTNTAYLPGAADQNKAADTDIQVTGKKKASEGKADEGKTGTEG